MNQRKFKFRVWDSIYSSMSYGNIDVKAYLDNEGISRNGYVLQQYTGLNDINGKEIYEGDIVIWPNNVKDENIPNPYRNEDAGQFLYTTRKTRKQVMWTHYMKFSLVDIPADGSMTYSFNQFCEVIGNIFENTELLRL